MTRLSAHFELEEFASGDGAPMPSSVETNIRTRLVPALQTLRDALGGPLVVRSGYRSPAHNRAEGGARASQHLLGLAADLVPPSGVPVEDLATLVEELIKKGKIPEGGLGLYDGRIHYDVRGKRARWDKRTKVAPAPELAPAAAPATPKKGKGKRAKVAEAPVPAAPPAEPSE